MAARDPDLVETISGITSWLDDDTGLSDVTNGATDNNTGSPIARISKNEEGLRIAFNDGLSGLAAGDTVSVYQVQQNGATTWALLAYTDSNTVTATDKLTSASMTAGFVVFTFTANFITQLGDLGSGAFAVRFTEDLVTSFDGNDNRFSEVDADLTVAAVTRRVMVIS